ncbi:hypothetical protein LguiA_000434 [Lonicera macranthoides]
MAKLHLVGSTDDEFGSTGSLVFFLNVNGEEKSVGMVSHRFLFFFFFFFGFKCLIAEIREMSVGMVHAAEQLLLPLFFFFFFVSSV